ncbi:hypothetical protein [Curtobacterium sp. PhB137]|uniref:hypothetical protein n=1 Tax=Curtobacterium sp. PhB137 TaxID=2485182 RepID=UPI000F50C9B6|nr:hypothetical protein [Curtobacterium sp. PhB137]
MTTAHRAPLTSADPVRAALIATATQLLDALGAGNPAAAAVDLVGLIDALTLYRIADVGPVDSLHVLEAYFTGLVREHQRAARTDTTGEQHD